MKWLMLVATLLISGQEVANAEESSRPGLADQLRRFIPPAPKLPEMPDVFGAFTAFVQQVSDSQSLVKELGFDIVTFKIQFAVPPLSKLTLRSTGREISEEQLETVVAKTANGGIFIKTLVTSAVQAKRLQSKMNFGTVILDMDYALTPSIKVCFLKEAITRDVELYYLGCAH